MRPDKVYKGLLWVQGGYTLLTALWGLIDIDSFMLVTGPKVDTWLVKTVSVTLVAISVTLILHVLVFSDPLPAIVLGFLTSAGLAVIDFYYSGIGRIGLVYALDGLVEGIFALVWGYLFLNQKRIRRGKLLK